MHHYDCFDLPWQVWFLLRAKCFRVRIPWAHQIPSSLPVRLFGPPYTVVLSHNILNIVTVNSAIVYLPQIEARKSGTKSLITGFGSVTCNWKCERSESADCAEGARCPEAKWNWLTTKEVRPQLVDLLRDNLLFKSSFFSAETSILEMYYGCFFVCWSAKSSFNNHKTVFNDNKTIAFCNSYFNLWGFCKCVLMLAIWHLKVGLLN